MRVDKIVISELKIDTLIGILPHERTQAQTIAIDLEMQVDVHKVALKDDIQVAVDYSQVAQYITDYVISNHFNLIETLAEHLAVELIHQFNLNWLQISVTKFAVIPNAKSVKVVIERP
ncbi:MAG: dihydroneopterin aldolase [Coxiellaceae bacterium]|nr:MAG: dihydroneopterin aldolase [Coxiellaceae bacterium]